MFPLDLLQEYNSKPVLTDIEINKARIKKTLDHFGIQAEMGDVYASPTVTKFVVKVKEGIILSKVMELQSVFAMNLAARSARVEIINSEKSLMGIEVPNKIVSVANPKEVLVGSEFKNVKSDLKFPLGINSFGQNVIADLAKLPHLFMAGCTGSGKSVFISSIIMSLLYNLDPSQLRLVLIDPKRVELSPYNGIPHLLMPVMTKTEQAVIAFKEITDEMEERYELLKKLNVADIDSYNNTVQETEGRMFKIVLIIDELSDLMINARMETEIFIIRLAQMGDKVGIHLILSTSRPAVNVFTSLIKFNINSRIGFYVPNAEASENLIGEKGAEKLLGKGDMLFKIGDEPLIRLQAFYVSEEEKESIIDFLKK